MFWISGKNVKYEHVLGIFKFVNKKKGHNLAEKRKQKASKGIRYEFQANNKHVQVKTFEANFFRRLQVPSSCFPFGNHFTRHPVCGNVTISESTQGIGSAKIPLLGFHLEGNDSLLVIRQPARIRYRCIDFDGIHFVRKIETYRMTWIFEFLYLQIFQLSNARTSEFSHLWSSKFSNFRIFHVSEF